MARENLVVSRRGRTASLKWLANGLRESEKRGKYFSALKLQNSGAATGPADYADCFVCKSDCDAIISPLDKDGPFGEVEYGCKAENKDAVKWRNQKRELKMGFLVPICMLAMIVICAATLTRL
jgi:hypothetical protein